MIRTELPTLGIFIINMALKVIKISRVSPATDSSCDSVDPLVFPLTFFDLRWVRSHPTQQVIFYKLSKLSREFFHSLILPRLELSLALVLRHYLPFTGHLMWDLQDPKPRIVVSRHDTVSLTVAESDVDFSFISGKGLRPQTELRVLVPELTVSSDSASLYSLQITLFPNQGFCIGIAEHHVVKDGLGSIMFIKSWAHICKSLEHGIITFPCLPMDLTPILERTLINVSPSLEMKILESMSYFLDETNGKRTLNPPSTGDISTDLVRITLELTQENVKELKEQAKRESARSNLDLHLSSFVVTNAYLFSCLVKARGSNERPVLFMYAADLRSRLEPPVSERYLGNCVFLVCCFGNNAKTFLERDGFINAVEILGDSVKGLYSQGIEKLCELYIDGTKNVKPGTQVESVSGSHRTGVYGSDFGWGKPANHEIVSIDRYAAFTISERRDEIDGIEIGVCLKKSEMDTFISLFNYGLDIIVSRI